MPQFKVGDRVRWHRDHKASYDTLIGTIRTAAYDDEWDTVSLYEVEFSYGTVILRAAQLVHALDHMPLLN